MTASFSTGHSNNATCQCFKQLKRKTGFTVLMLKHVVHYFRAIFGASIFIPWMPFIDDSHTIVDTRALLFGGLDI